MNVLELSKKLRELSDKGYSLNEVRINGQRIKSVEVKGNSVKLITDDLSFDLENPPGTFQC